MKLVKPTLPITYLQDFFANCAADTLGWEMSHGNTDDAIEELFWVIQFFNELKEEADQQGGRLTTESNEESQETLIFGWQAMRTMGHLE